MDLFIWIYLFIFAEEEGGCGRTPLRARAAAALAPPGGVGEGRALGKRRGLREDRRACACAHPAAGLQTGAETEAASAGGPVRRRRGLACGGPPGTRPGLFFFFFLVCVLPPPSTRCASALL